MRRRAGLPFTAVLGAAAALLAACAEPDAGGSPPTTLSADVRIQDYANRIAEHPRIYATYLGLSQAYLDKARETYDPIWLTKAQAAAQTSLDIMPSLEGYKMQGRIAAFRHRFEDALEWSRRAAALLSADVVDGGVTGLQVEALMGLKRYDEARALLPADGAPQTDFHIAAATGHWLVSQGRRDEAAEAFLAASRIAAAQDAPSLAAWGEVMAAGVYLDVGALDPARPHLRAAAAFDAGNSELRIHEAELLVAEGDTEAAIAIYEKVLEQSAAPEIHRRIFVLAHGRGDDALARTHFEAAERILVRPLKLGEIYTRDELVRLYTDSGATPDDARRRVNEFIADDDEKLLLTK